MLFKKVPLIRGCLYEKRGGIKNGMRQSLFRFYMGIFQPGRDN